AFRQDVVLKYSDTIAQHLRAQQPLDYYDLRPHLRLERDKALAEFRKHGMHPQTVVAPEVAAQAAAAQPSSAKPTEPVPFTGGILAFFKDRVELCGVDICSGRRAATARKMLDILAEKDDRGIFVPVNAEDLAKRVGLRGGQNGACAAIRDLRLGIS